MRQINMSFRLACSEPAESPEPVEVVEGEQSGRPESITSNNQWIPAFAGMTSKWKKFVYFVRRINNTCSFQIRCTGSGFKKKIF
jgi:hypothetical protein